MKKLLIVLLLLGGSSYYAEGQARIVIYPNGYPRPAAYYYYDDIDHHDHGRGKAWKHYEKWREKQEKAYWKTFNDRHQHDWDDDDEDDDHDRSVVYRRYPPYPEYPYPYPQRRPRVILDPGGPVVIGR